MTLSIMVPGVPGFFIRRGMPSLASLFDEPTALSMALRPFHELYIDAYNCIGWLEGASS